MVSVEASDRLAAGERLHGGIRLARDHSTRIGVARFHQRYCSSVRLRADSDRRGSGSRSKGPSTHGDCWLEAFRSGWSANRKLRVDNFGIAPISADLEMSSLDAFVEPVAIVALLILLFRFTCSHSSADTASSQRVSSGNSVKQRQMKSTQGV